MQGVYMFVTIAIKEHRNLSKGNWGILGMKSENSRGESHWQKTISEM